MTKEQREHERIQFIKTIEKSWTWAKLTRFERSRISENLTFCKLYGNKTADVHEILNGIYKSFLDALEYNPTTWREPNPNELPQF